MADWQRTLNLTPHYENTRETKDYNGLCKIIAEKLRTLKPLGLEDIDLELQDIIEMFDDDAKDPEITIESFDQSMSVLYDWADQLIESQASLGSGHLRKKACWINTTDPGAK